MTVYKVDPDRVRYVAKLFGMSEEELCAKVGEGLKKEITVPELFGGEIKKSHLNRLMRVSAKEFGFWAGNGPTAEEGARRALYRKEKFSCKLEYQDRLAVAIAEEHALDLEMICGEMDRSMKRKLPRYRSADSPASTAYAVRERLGIDSGHPTARKFLEHLVTKLSEFNIVVNEYVEGANKKLKVKIAGFFIKPHTIIFKRQRQPARSIFTLVHELGHYLLDKEEINGKLFGKGLKGEESWCNEFAFHFVLGKADVMALHGFTSAQIEDTLGDVTDFAAKHHISRLAIYHHFARTKRITWEKYKEKEHQIARNWERIWKKRKENPSYARASKKIFSPLEREIYIDAYYADVVEEYDLLKRYESLRLEQILEHG